MLLGGVPGDGRQDPYAAIDSPRSAPKRVRRADRTSLVSQNLGKIGAAEAMELIGADKVRIDSAHSGAGLASAAEIVCLLVAAWMLFFVGLGRFDFIETEGLRAIVVEEMLQRPGYTMPTVHHHPYLRKPPLYAWTSVALSRRLGRFDEQVARLPSAISATLLVAFLYVAGERWIGRGGGLAAAVLMLANSTVLDYGFRAELDMPFALMTTVSLFLAWTALSGRGVGRHLAWLGCYAAAAAAAMWKGPHSLIFIWLALLTYGKLERRWDWLWHPAQLVGLAGTLAVLIGWSVALSLYAGAGEVGSTAVVELYRRLVPHGLADCLGVLWFPLVTVIVTVPASLFVLTSLHPVRSVPNASRSEPTNRTALSDCGAGNEHKWRRDVPTWCWSVLRSWIGRVRAEPFAAFLLSCVVPNLVFLMIVPAKSPRYTLPIFAPIVLLGAWVLTRDRAARAEADTVKPDAYEVLWRCVYGFLGAVGVLALILGGVVTVWADRPVGMMPVGSPCAWAILAGACLIAAGFEFFGRGGTRHRARLFGLLLVVLGAKPVIMDVWWPGRLMSDSMVAAAAAIDARVPPGEPVFVLKKNDCPDVAFYSKRQFYWIDDPSKAGARTPGAKTYFLMRDEDIDEAGALRLRSDFAELLTFTRTDRKIVLFTLDAAK